MIGTVALRFNTGNTMEERCSFATHISNITRNTNSFIHDSFGLHSSKEQEIRILSYGIHFIEYRKFQTIEMHSEHMMLNMIRSGIKDSQSTLIISSTSWFYKIPCKKVQRRCHIHGSTEYSLVSKNTRPQPNRLKGDATYIVAQSVRQPPRHKEYMHLEDLNTTSSFIYDSFYIALLEGFKTYELFHMELISYHAKNLWQSHCIVKISLHPV